MATGNEPKILCIGMVCLDELLYCDSFPIEDGFQRCIDRKLSPGGNACNNCKVLTALDVKCDLFGTVNLNCPYGRIIKEQLDSLGVSVEQCEIIEGYDTPIAACIINEQNGSRTSIYYSKIWPEPSYEAFLKKDLSQYTWIHIEMRNFTQVRKIVQRIMSWNCNSSGSRKPITLSLEMENYDDECMEFMPWGDYVIVSKEFARALGYNTMSEALDGCYRLLKPGATLLVPWGEEGASARGPAGTFRSPAFPPSIVVDTLGAGDTFWAALVASVVRGRPLDHSLRFACRVAGAKVGMRGFHRLRGALGHQGISLQ